MAKRFTATEKWEDAWFRKLKPMQKLLWIYMLDRCDLAGVLDMDVELAQFCIGGKVSFEGFEGRIVRFNGSKVWIPKFIEFQYGCTAAELNANVPVHRAALRSVEKYGLLEKYAAFVDSSSLSEQLPKCSPTLKYKDMDKDKDKSKDKDRPTDLETVKSLFTERHYALSEAEKFWNYYESNGWKVGKNPMKDWRAAAANWNKNAKEWGTSHGTNYSPPDPGPRMKRCEKCGKEFPSKFVLCPKCYPDEPTKPPEEIRRIVDSLAGKMDATE